MKLMPGGVVDGGESPNAGRPWANARNARPWQYIIEWRASTAKPGSLPSSYAACIFVCRLKVTREKACRSYIVLDNCIFRHCAVWRQTELVHAPAELKRNGKLNKVRL